MSEFIEPERVASLLQNIPCPWGVAGGWAIDLFLNRVTRKHQDIEVAILREDQLVLQEYLSFRGWAFDYVDQGKFSPWPVGKSLELPNHEIWGRAQSGPLRCLEVLLNERQGETFIFRRDARIVAPLDRAFVSSTSGIPVLAPEIVLWYKSKRAGESKEQLDFSNALAALDTERRQWLSESLAVADPSHVWLPQLATSWLGAKRQIEL